jgi:hypothetical protein
MRWSSRLWSLGLLGGAVAAALLPASAEARRGPDVRGLLRCRATIIEEGLRYNRHVAARVARCLKPLGACRIAGGTDPSCRGAAEVCARVAAGLAEEEGRFARRVADTCGGLSMSQLMGDLGYGVPLAGCAADTVEAFAGCLGARLHATGAADVLALEPAACTLLAAAGLGSVMPAEVCAPPPPPPPPPGGADGPLYCGGPEDVACPAGSGCDRTDALCTLAAPAGRCVPLPDACADDGMPVCGCDGQTYASDCDRVRAGVVKSRDGACDPAPAACGNSNGGCSAGMFCEYVEGDCGEGQPGVCRPMRAEPCDLCLAYVDGPVCGCNFVTYASDCERQAAGVAKIWDGPCL